MRKALENRTVDFALLRSINELNMFQNKSSIPLSISTVIQGKLYVGVRVWKGLKNNNNIHAMRHYLKECLEELGNEVSTKPLSLCCVVLCCVVLCYVMLFYVRLSLCCYVYSCAKLFFVASCSVVLCCVTRSLCCTIT